ncbi:MAG: DNA polymerase III subunit alpha, partial [Acidimicrobiales bacterium]
GLLKMDFLGLRNLSVIERALDLIEASTGARPDLNHVDMEDEATYALLKRGDSVGVFQLEGGPMRSLMRSLAPASFDDVSVLIALYRPGPMAANMHLDYAERKNGRQAVTYMHPDMEKVLGDTYGLCVYQEQMMGLARQFAGYTVVEADKLREGAAKKKRDVMAAEREKFIAGCDRTGYGSELGKRIFDMIEPFADYAFCRAHAYGYGLVSYWTAWLKAHYPVEYLAALLTSVADDKDRTALYLAESRAMGIEVLVPDVNLSVSDFAALPERSAITFGLSSVRNVGSGLVERIVAERESGGPFEDFYDFANRVDPVVLNKRTVDSLIKAGAFDSMGVSRMGLCQVYEQVVEATLARRREADLGVMTLFAAAPGEASVFDDSRVPVPEVEFDKTTRLALEKEMLGLYVSDHPMRGMEAALARQAEITIADLLESVDASVPTGPPQWVGGVVTGLARKYTRRGELMATFFLEDLQSSVEVWVFPKAMLEVGHMLADDQVVCVKGRMSTRDDTPKLFCLELRVPKLVAGGTAAVHLGLPAHALSDTCLAELKSVLREHPGESPVFLHLGARCLKLTGEYSVDASNGLI